MPRPVSTLSALMVVAAAVSAATAQTPDGTFASDQRFLPQDGAVLYRSICQGCHMPDGKGASGAGKYPALAGNDKLEIGGYPVFIVVHGQKGMPGFGEYLDDAQVAAVVGYIRTHFGNDYPEPISPDDVKAVR